MDEAMRRVEARRTIERLGRTANMMAFCAARCVKPMIEEFAMKDVNRAVIPILGINAVTFWYALRENGFEGALVGAGRLLREF